MQTLPQFLTEQFVIWQAKERGRRTLEDFANYLDVNRSLLSYWINGSRVPSKENIEKIAYRLGNEIYDVLEMERPNAHLQKINRLWEFIPEDIQIKIADEAAKYEIQNEQNRLSKAPKPRAARRPK